MELLRITAAGPLFCDDVVSYPRYKSEPAPGERAVRPVPQTGDNQEGARGRRALCHGSSRTDGDVLRTDTFVNNFVGHKHILHRETDRCRIHTADEGPVPDVAPFSCDVHGSPPVSSHD